MNSQKLKHKEWKYKNEEEFRKDVKEFNFNDKYDNDEIPKSYTSDHINQIEKEKNQLQEKIIFTRINI